MSSRSLTSRRTAALKRRRVQRNVSLAIAFARMNSEPGAWWRQPLPAWAQVAAAVVIFAAGMSVNIVRVSDEAPAAVAQASAPQPVAAPASVSEIAVTRAEFARLAERLRALEHADVQLASRTSDGVDSNELFQRIAAIEDRFSATERQNLGNFAMLARAVETMRRETDATREAAQRVTLVESELEDHRQLLRNTIIPAGLAMRTSLTSGR